jgi:hypothetical protein
MTPKEVKDKTMIARERWIVHKYTERAVAKRRTPSCRRRGNIYMTVLNFHRRTPSNLRCRSRPRAPMVPLSPAAE